MLRKRDSNPPGFGHFKMATFTVQKTSDFSGESRICRGKSRTFRRRSHTFRVKAGRFVGKKPGSSGEKARFAYRAPRFFRHCPVFPRQFGTGRDGTGRDWLREHSSFSLDAIERVGSHRSESRFQFAVVACCACHASCIFRPYLWVSCVSASSSQSCVVVPLFLPRRI